MTKPWFWYPGRGLCVFDFAVWFPSHATTKATALITLGNPVYTSNNVEATFDFVEPTFDFIAKNGNNVERDHGKIRPFDKVETN